MLFYKLDQLLKSSNNNSDKLVKSLYKLYLYKANKLNDYYLPKVDISGGTSFLVNPKDLFEDKLSNSTYKAQYIILAGKRDYNLYKQYGIKYLDLSYYPDIETDRLKYNPLLNINSKKIKFKFEE